MPFCNNCGSKYSFGDPECLNCGNLLPTTIKNPIHKNDEDKYRRTQLKRISAAAIDISLAILLFFIFILYKKIVLLVVLKRGLAIIIPHLYLLLKDSIEGKSIGKMLMGIIVYNKKERKQGGIFDSIIRNWYLAIPIIGPTIFASIIGFQILTGAKQRIGDKSANTIVLSDSDFQRVS